MGRILRGLARLLIDKADEYFGGAEGEESYTSAMEKFEEKKKDLRYRTTTNSAHPYQWSKQETILWNDKYEWADAMETCHGK